MRAKEILIFLAGVLVGGLTVGYYTKQKHEEFVINELDEVKSRYLETLEENTDNVPEEFESDGNEADGNPFNNKVEKAQSLADENARLKEEIKIGAMNYNKLTKSEGYSTAVENVFDKAANEHPNEEENGVIYVISPDEYMEGYHFYDEETESNVNAEHDRFTLFYYEDDDVLYNEDDEEVIDDVEETIGDHALSNVGEYERDTVYVRNTRLGADYEVRVIHSSYSKDILGFPDA